jgi:hypothetical protein
MIQSDRSSAILPIPQTPLLISTDVIPNKKQVYLNRVQPVQKTAIESHRFGASGSFKPAAFLMHTTRGRFYGAGQRRSRTFDNSSS